MASAAAMTPCPKCGRQFKGQKGLRIHYGKMHKQTRASTSLLMGVNIWRNPTAADAGFTNWDDLTEPYSERLTDYRVNEDSDVNHGRENDSVQKKKTCKVTKEEESPSVSDDSDVNPRRENVSPQKMVSKVPDKEEYADDEGSDLTSEGHVSDEDEMSTIPTSYGMVRKNLMDIVLKLGDHEAEEKAWRQKVAQQLEEQTRTIQELQDKVNMLEKKTETITCLQKQIHMLEQKLAREDSPL